MIEQSRIDRILVECSTSNEVLRQLYLLAREADKKYSVQFIANRTGADSKSYLNDVMYGRRRLKAKDVIPLADFFGLSDPQGKLFKVLNDLQFTKQAERRQFLESKIVHYKSLLTGPHNSVTPPQMADRN